MLMVPPTARVFLAPAGRLQRMASAGCGSLRPLRHLGHTPAPYAYLGLPAFAFALHGLWRLGA